MIFRIDLTKHVVDFYPSETNWTKTKATTGDSIASLLVIENDYLYSSRTPRRVLEEESDFVV